MQKKFFYDKSAFSLLDFCSIFIPFLLVLYSVNIFYPNITSLIPSYPIYKQILLHLVLSYFCILWFWLKLRHYTYRKTFWVELREIIYTLFLFCIIELSFIAFLKLTFSRTFFILMWSNIFLLFPLVRFIVKFVLIKNGKYRKKTIIIGANANALEAYQAIKSEFFLGLDVVYFLDVNTQSENVSNAYLKNLNIPILFPDRDNLFSLVDKDNAQFILALEDNQTDELDYWVKLLAKHHCRAISIVPSLKGLPLYNTDVSFIFSHEVMLLRVQNRLAKRSSRILKRAMDIFISLALIIVLSPFLLWLYYLVAKDGGKAIYAHKRVGMNKKVFGCLKFRTMVLNSDEVLRSLLKNDPEAKAEWEKDFKLKNDPRITKIGHFLRKTSLDELPQLFNVLKGDMSLVGPRPIVRQELIRYRDELDYYLMTRPGMTGLWQISGRNNIDYSTRVYYDAWYVRNWSIWNDITILFKTARVVFEKTGAY
ncbi:undecaprenyl-phosphate galactose phosphotransferase WbaP [Avibacterium sp. 21-599]|uniref:undecaprenyl-phosphate galactose phosphotransferase WbaP n=1 Tax=Avibacterium sp. 21-599 TaxID=2911528 RepID=UPI0022485501|nr:undecaprenyl-phosphate galactose phosphotransferase WbaP [Avibacterium sp. 21-599]MCW9718788.1 undecaprenyl-phosphate galactose phosphotransferase WbaP [Avibacterium sp. 21-599]